MFFKESIFFSRIFNRIHIFEYLRGRGKFRIHLAKEGIGALQISHLDVIDIKPLQLGAPGSNGHVQALAGDVHLSI